MPSSLITTRRLAWLLALVPAAGVLIIDPSGWSPFGPAKWAAVVVAGLVALAAVVARGTLRVSRPLLAVWGLFLGWAVLAAADGVDPRLAWLGTPQRHFGVLTWILCAFMFCAGQSLDLVGGRVLAKALTIVAGLSGAWAGAELLGWRPVDLAAGSRLVGSLGSASYLGAAEALIVPVALGVVADPIYRRQERAAAGVCAGLGVVALVGSGARAAWVGVFVSAAALTVVHRRVLVQHLPRRRVIAGAVVGVAVLTGLAFATGTASRIPATFDSHQVGGLSRLAEWRVAVDVLGEHPLTGVGPEGYRIAFGASVGASYQRDYGRDPLPDRAHDSLLDVAVTTGVPGLIAYLALMALIGRYLWRALRRGPPWVAGVAAGLVAYWVGALFLFPLAEIDPAAWMMAGVVVACSARQSEVMALRLPRLVSVAFVGAAGVAVFFGSRAVAADRDMNAALASSARGEQVGATRLASRAVRLDPGNIVIRLAAAEIDASSSTLPGVDAGLSEIAAGLSTSPADPVLGDEGATLLLTRAQLTGSVSDWTRCETALLSLIRSDPLNPSILLQLGVVYDDLGQDDQAGAAWREAAALAPHSAAPEADLAVLYQGEGLLRQARSAAGAALRVDAGDPLARQVLSQDGGDGT